MNLEEMTIEQLKAVGFDLIGQINIAQHNLGLVQQVIVKKEGECNEQKD